MSDKAINRLSQEIFEEAEIEKASMLKEAKEKAGIILSEAKAEMDKKLGLAEEEMKIIYSQNLDNNISAISAENKSEMLKLKLQYVDEIVEEVKKSIEKSTKKQIKSFLKKEVENLPVKEGEYQIGSEEERIDAEIIKDIFKGRKIILSKKNADFAKGLKILSNKIEYTISPESKLESMIDEIKMEISNRLFGGGSD